MRFVSGLAASFLTFGAVIAIAFPTIALPGILSTEDTDGQVNIRAGANTRSRILQQLPNGTAVEVLNIFQAEDSRYWYYIKAARTSLEGWVDSGWVRLTLNNNRYATLKGDRNEKINVRSAPRQNSRIVHQGLVGDLVLMRQDARNDGNLWYLVEFPSQVKGWVRADLLMIWPKGCIITCPDI